MSDQCAKETQPGVVSALNAWIDAAGIDWKDPNTEIVALPDAFNADDISRVALYGMNVRDIEALSRSIDIQHPKRSFAPLLLLSEMVPLCHPRQLEAVHRNLKPCILLEMAVNGHCQCKEYSGKLFLRAWGHLQGALALDVLQFLIGHSESLRAESLRCLRRTVSLNLSKLADFEMAVVQLSTQEPQLMYYVLNHVQHPSDAQEQDGAALLLLWIIQVPVCRESFLARPHEILDCIMGQPLRSKDVHLQQAIMTGLIKASEDTEIANAICVCEGISLLTEFLILIEEDPNLHKNSSLKDSHETLFALSVQLVWRLVACRGAVGGAVRDNKLSNILRRISRQTAFMTSQRFQQISFNYIDPLLAALNDTSQF